MYFDDGLMSFFLYFVLFPVIAIILLIWLLFKEPIRKLHDRWLACVFGSDTYLSMQNEKVGPEKESLFGPLWTLKGDNREFTLLEVGPGVGTNFKFYPKGTNIICVDPNPNFQSVLEKNAAEFPHVNMKQFITAKGENMSDVPNGVCDAVVCTMVACSTEHVDEFLKEIKRVLKPGGMFFYLEHVAARRYSWFYLLQSFLNPVWRRCFGGCQLTCETWKSIEQAGFSEMEYRRFSTKSWSVVMRYILVGIATK